MLSRSRLGARLPPATPPGSRPQGFTLIEVLIVMALIATLAGIALTNYHNAVIRSKEAVLKEDLFRLRDVIDQYYSDKGKFPASLDALVSEGYLRSIPNDPFTNSNTTWQTVTAEVEAADPNAEPGIWDLHSGSDQTALDGSKYAEW